MSSSKCINTRIKTKFWKITIRREIKNVNIDIVTNNMIFKGNTTQKYEGNYLNYLKNKSLLSTY